MGNIPGYEQVDSKSTLQRIKFTEMVDIEQRKWEEKPQPTSVDIAD